MALECLGEGEQRWKGDPTERNWAGLAHVTGKGVTARFIWCAALIITWLIALIDWRREGKKKRTSVLMRQRSSNRESTKSINLLRDSNLCSNSEFLASDNLKVS